MIGPEGSSTCKKTFRRKLTTFARVLKQNSYPANFLRNASALPTQKTADASSPDEGQEVEKGPLVVIPYVAGMSEDIRCVSRKFNIRVGFKSGWTLRSMLTKVKDILPLGKQSNVLYHIPCSCGQVYIRETKWRLETRRKEHQDACKRMEEVGCSRACMGESPPDLLGRDHRTRPWQRTLMKEALHIQMIPAEERFNQDGVLEVPGCWTAVMRRREGRSNLHQPLTSNDMYPQ